MLFRLIKAEKQLCLAGMVIAGLLLMILVLLSGINVACRLAGHPLSASYELSGFFGALIAALALADTQRKRGHVELDLFTRTYSAKARRWLGAFNVFLGALLLLALACQLTNRARVLIHAGEVSETLKLPYPWLMFGAVFGFGLLIASFLTDFVLLLSGHSHESVRTHALQRNLTVNSIRGDIEPESTDADTL